MVNGTGREKPSSILEQSGSLMLLGCRLTQQMVCQLDRKIAEKVERLRSDRTVGLVFLADTYGERWRCGPVALYTDGMPDLHIVVLWVFRAAILHAVIDVRDAGSGHGDVRLLHRLVLVSTRPKREVDLTFENDFFDGDPPEPLPVSLAQE